MTMDPDLPANDVLISVYCARLGVFRRGVACTFRLMGNLVANGWTFVSRVMTICVRTMLVVLCWGLAGVICTFDTSKYCPARHKHNGG